MKRLLAAALVFILILSALAPVIAESIYDEAGEILSNLDVLRGDENGNLMLNSNLKRQDMVVMISRLYKKEDIAKSFKGKNVFKDLNAERKFYIPYIAWAREEGLIQGMEKDEFGFNSYTTVQEFQTVLLRALGYGEEAKNWNKVPELAEKMGIMKNLDLNPKSKLSRGQMAMMVLNTLRENKRGMIVTLGEVLGLDIPELFQVDAKVTIDRNIVTFQGKVEGTNSIKLYIRPTSSGISSGERLIDIELDKNGNFNHVIKDLESGSYEYRFEGNNEKTNFKPLKIEQVAFDLVDVSANNLKEISLEFTQAVDTQLSSFISNYSTNAGTIQNIRFENNNRTIILTLNGIMNQQGNYKVSAYRVKSVDGQELDIRDKEFRVFDNSTPDVLDVVQLGNKGLKVVFSEPIKMPTQRNFKIDGKSFYGNVKLDNNVVTLTYYSSNSSLNEGQHTLTVTGIEDYAGYKAIDENIDFNVIKDTTPPVVVDARATLEEVIIEFDEDIDPVSQRKDNFYWRYGSIKRFPDTVKFVNNKAYLEFKNNRLSTNETTIYIENVVDYSGNKIKLTEIKVTPVIDKTSPEVVSYKVADDGKSITVYYSKNVNGKNRANYSIKDRNDKTVYIRDIQGSGREFNILLSSPLPIGINTLTIEGVEDTTPIRNILIPFETKIDMKDVQKPKIISHTGYGNTVMLEFSKEMDMGTVMNHDNYYIDFGGIIQRLPYESLITPGNNGMSVTIILPSTLSGKEVKIGQNLKAIDIRGLKDISGNDTDPLIINLKFDGTASGKAKAVDYYNDRPGKQGVLVEDNIVKIRFNMPIVQADERDFSITGRTVESVRVDGTNEVLLYLNYNDDTSIANGKVTIKDRNSMITSIDTGVEPGTVYILDEVAPRVKENVNTLRTSSNTIYLPFTEDLEEIGAALYKRDLEIIRDEDGYILRDNDYSTALDSDKSILRISINNREINSRYTVRVTGESSDGNPTYIRDKDGNLALGSGAYYITDSTIYKY